MAKKSISWSATANKEWVTLEPTEGFGDSNMKVIVQPAESQDDDLEATITITYGNGKVVNRTVSRCERKPLSNGSRDWKHGKNLLYWLCAYLFS